MKKFLVWGIALALVFSMGITGFIWFVNNGAAEENRVELATMIEWDLERDHGYDYDVEIESVEYRDGRAWANYVAYNDGEIEWFGGMDVKHIENQYTRFHREKG